jgi:hypothetical protein
VVKIFIFNMSGMYCVQNSQFQDEGDVSWSKLSVSACLKCIVPKISSFSI